MPPTPSSPPASPSSTSSPICASASAPISRTWAAAWASTSASACSSSPPVRAMVAPASRRDTRALAHTARHYGNPFSIVENVIAANEARKQALADRIQQALGETLAGKKIALLGIAFKAETDDIRDAAALTLIPELQKRGAAVAAFDPVAMDNGRAAFEDVQWCADAIRRPLEQMPSSC